MFKSICMAKVLVFGGGKLWPIVCEAMQGQGYALVGEVGFGEIDSGGRQGVVQLV